MALLADTRGAKLTKMLSEANQQNWFLKRQNALHESQGSYLKRVTQSHWALLQYSGPKRNKH
ncbi:hypothetical protein JHK87_024956 [Glycine soja]|nr:hypothetical protein JHK87_024956 [Glycine soja]